VATTRKLQRMYTNRIPKQALQYRPKGRRNIGRPRKRWRDQLPLKLHEHDDDDDDECASVTDIEHRPNCITCSTSTIHWVTLITNILALYLVNVCKLNQGIFVYCFFHIIFFIINTECDTHKYYTKFRPTQLQVLLISIRVTTFLGLLNCHLPASIWTNSVLYSNAMQMGAHVYII
jgi:hypothetical protein